MDTSSNDQQSDLPRIIAVVSGKGGSGKTMVVAVMATVLSTENKRTLIVDADTGTAGMTYYLGLNLVSNIRVGLSNIAKASFSENMDETIKKSVQKVKGAKNSDFLGIGDHRRLEKEVPEDDLPNILKETISKLRQVYPDNWIIIDCRGGIDRESVAVCSEADDIILIAESDTTSFQATKHVVDVLSDNDIAHKIRGFFINKVFNNPSVIVAQGTSVFGTQFLSAIPFDLQATRSFLVGDIPKIYSPFGRHVWAGLHKAYAEEVNGPPMRPWNFEEYRELGLTNLDSLRGGIFASALILILGIAVAFRLTNSVMLYYIEDRITTLVFFVALFLLGLMGSIESTRRLLGRIISTYIRLIFRSPDQ